MARKGFWAGFAFGALFGADVWLLTNVAIRFNSWNPYTDFVLPVAFALVVMVFARVVAGQS